MIRVHHDFETFSELDITEVGAYKYAMHPSTEVLMLSWAVGHEAPQLWVPAEGEPMPGDLEALIWASIDSDNPEIEWHAFNANFERLIWWHVLRYKIPMSLFHCTMQHAWMLSFSGGLAQVGDQMGLRQDYKKLADGKKLIHKFCKPAPRNHKAERYTHENAPDDWHRFKQYCVQDVIAEREIEMLLSGYPIPERERELWLWDQEVNDAGIPVDTALVDRAVVLEASEKRRLRDEMNSITYLDNANSAAQLQPWLQARGVHLPNMQKATIERYLGQDDVDPTVRRILESKQIVGKTSATKWQAFQRATCDDGLLRGMFQFGGAQRTQRWAGRIVQLHNMARGALERPDIAADVLFDDESCIRTLYGDIITLLSDTLRCAITAPDGYLFAPCDLSSIESRWLGYMSGCRRINDLFARGKDTYKDFATEYYGVPYDEVTKAQRTFVKPPELGCGYRLSSGDERRGGGLIEYAKSMGVKMTVEEARRAVDLWRGRNPEVVDMWSWFDEAIKATIEDGQVREGYTVRIRRDDNFLIVDLPSERSIYYYQPLVTMETAPWEISRIKADMEELREQDALTGTQRDYELLYAQWIAEAKRIPTISYMGMNQYTKQWERITSHGGKFTENFDQASCRDLLAFHMQLITDELGPIIRGHVHDECIPLVRAENAEANLRAIEDIMRVAPPWAPSILLDAKGFITKRYRKD